MKRTIKIALLLCLSLIVSTLMFTACNITDFLPMLEATTPEETTPATHVHTVVIDSAVAPTCTEPGFTEGEHCSVCNEIIVPQETVEALGHTDDSFTITPPTATENGYTTFICSVCNNTYIEEDSIIPTNFTIKNDNREMIGYTGTDGENLVIPAVFQIEDIWYRVTMIEDLAFEGCSNIKKITIPASVTSINADVFNGCSNLENIDVDDDNPNYTSINGNLYSKDKKTLKQYAIGKTDSSFIIPDSVTDIMPRSFSGCKNLKKITIPDSVTSIGSSAFAYCTNLENVKIPNGVTNIGMWAFEDCTNLESITIGDGITKIDFATFYGCTRLSSVSFGTNVEIIGDSAFYDCRSLTSIIIPDSVTKIEQIAFFGCSSLKEVIIPNSVTSLGNNAFQNCSSLTNIIIPSSVTKIEFDTFSGCYSLSSISIPDSITNIDNQAFYYCENLREITIGNSVVTIGDYAFYSSMNLEKIFFNGTKEQWQNIHKGIYWDGFTGNYTVHCTDGTISKQ